MEPENQKQDEKPDISTNGAGYQEELPTTPQTSDDNPQSAGDVIEPRNNEEDDSAPQPTTDSNENGAAETDSSPTERPQDAGFVNNSLNDPKSFGSTEQKTEAYTPMPVQTSSDQQMPKSNKKLLYAAIIGAALIALAAYFAWYLPNRPENVYSTSMERTGMVLEDFASDISSMLSEESLNQFESLELNGELSIKTPDYNINGSLITYTQKPNTDSTITLKVDPKDENSNEGFDVKAEIITNRKEADKFFNTYFKISGLKQLDPSNSASEFGFLEDQWVSLTSDYIESVSDDTDYLDVDEGLDIVKDLTSQDVEELVTAVIDDMQEYVFTADEEKGIIKVLEYIGEEEPEPDLKTFRYTATIDRDNYLTYCDVSSETVSSSTFSQKVRLEDQTQEEQKASIKKSCQEGLDEYEDEDYFEIWADRKTRLIHKMRFYDDINDLKTYGEIGQRYRGGDEIPLFVNYVDGSDEQQKQEYKATLSMNQSTNTWQFNVDYQKTGDKPLKVGAKLSVKPHTGDIRTEEPEGAMTVEELYEQLYGVSYDESYYNNNYDFDFNDGVYEMYDIEIEQQPVEPSTRFRIESQTN
jgi:hypothetical protein